MKVFDEAYNRAQEFFESVIDENVTPFGDFVWDFFKSLAVVLFEIIIYSTLPIWIIPYEIAKRCKKTKSEETLSPEIKQAILDDFMKGCE